MALFWMVYWCASSASPQATLTDSGWKVMLKPLWAHEFSAQAQARCCSIFGDEHLIGGLIDTSTLHRRTHAARQGGEHPHGLSTSGASRVAADRVHHAERAVDGFAHVINVASGRGGLSGVRGSFGVVKNLTVLLGVRILLRFERVNSRCVVVVVVVEPMLCAVVAPPAAMPVSRIGLSLPVCHPA